MYFSISKLQTQQYSPLTVTYTILVKAQKRMQPTKKIIPINMQTKCFKAQNFATKIEGM
jgi:hypothetical protein